MAAKNRLNNERRLERIIILLVTLLLINPFVIYLISENLLLSISLPFFLLALAVLLREKKKLRPISIIVFNLIFIVSFFLYMEAIFTFNFSEYIIEDLYTVHKNYYFNRPYLEQTFYDKEFIVQYNTNKQGFRIGSIDDPEKEVENVDWLFLGDSFTQGAQVQYEDLFTSQLFNHFPNKIIVNAGISGFGLPDEYNYYKKEGNKLKAKKVFLQICNFNDFMNVAERKLGFSDYLMHYSNFARFLLYGLKYANPEELPLGRWSEPFYPDEKSNEDYNIFYKPSSEIKQKDIRNFEIYLKKINDIVKEDNGELIVIQIPTKEQVNYRYFEEVILNFNIDVVDLDMQLPNNIVDSLSKKLGIKHIDLFNDFTNSEANVFYDYDEHLNTHGHQVTASAIRNSMKINDKEQNCLSSYNNGDRYPVFSASNENLISYQSYRNGNMELFIGDSLLENSERLTYNDVDEMHPWLSPDNSKIIFTEGDQDIGKTNIVIMNLDGSERKPITLDENTYGAIPSFSSDGGKIVYAEWKILNHKNTEPYIVVYDLVSNEKSIITSDKYESWRPIFTSDDSKVIYISKENDNQFDVYEHNLITGNKRNLTNTEHDEWDPAISKNGDKLVFSSHENDNWDLFLYDFKTRSISKLTSTKGNEWDATFSPNDDYVYFAATYGLRDGVFRIKID